MSRRDSRTDEQRQADDDRERAFHRARREAGLPHLNYRAAIEFSIRDVTDAEAEEFHSALWGAALSIANAMGVAAAKAEPERGGRTPTVGGSTYHVEKNIFGVEEPGAG